MIDQTVMDMIQAITSCVMAAFTVATFIALVVYTNETKKLRLAAQKQNEHLLLPILFFGQTKYDVLGNQAERLIIRNIGSGPAFNAYTEPMTVGATTIEFHHSGTLAAGESNDVTVVLKVGATETETASTVVLFWNRLRTMAKSDDYRNETAIHYDAANGAKHRVNIEWKIKGHQIKFLGRYHS